MYNIYYILYNMFKNCGDYQRDAGARLGDAVTFKFIQAEHEYSLCLFIFFFSISSDKFVATA